MWCALFWLSWRKTRANFSSELHTFVFSQNLIKMVLISVSLSLDFIAPRLQTPPSGQAK
jgi:hypothetical protein